jgi:hypothetical protein
MSENRDHLKVGATDQPQLFWRLCRQLAAVLAFGIFGAGAALAISNHAAQAPGAGCGWGNLTGNLGTPPKFALAFDVNFNMQPFFKSGAGSTIPQASWPPPKPTPDATVLLETHHTNSHVKCVIIDGQRECFRT